MGAPLHADTDPRPTADPEPRGRPLSWLAVIVGVVISTLGLGLTAAGILLAVAESAQRDGRYVFTQPEEFRSVGHAIVSDPFTLDTGDGDGSPTGAFGLDELISIRIRATPVIPGQSVFLAIADADEAARYLEDVPHAVFGDDPWVVGGSGIDADRAAPTGVDDGLDEVPGTSTPDPPVGQRFWYHSTVGSTPQTLTVTPRSGTWVIVVMNADGSRPVWVDVEAGAHTELFGMANPATLIAGLVGLLVGIPLILLGAAGLGRGLDRGLPPGPLAPAGPDPLRLTGHPDAAVSRALWLVKWLLAIPHYIVLAVLGSAVVVVTIAAGVAILATGRYPRSWFAFTAGVLRWHWRVGFYAYAVLGTDRYPPFTLARTEYPAELEVVRPERLSRGLVLVKWWLLVIPHLLVVGILTGGGAAATRAYRDGAGVTTGVSLLGLLVLIAAIALLFTGRYPQGLFALNVGLNRWVYRVASYVLLLRDEYPPFRLDQGPTEPGSSPVGAGVGGPGGATAPGAPGGHAGQ